jgi:hypothetical protein
MSASCIYLLPVFRRSRKKFIKQRKKQPKPPSLSHKALNSAKLRERLKISLCRGLLARQGASLEMCPFRVHQSACGLLGPRGFESPSRRHHYVTFFFLLEGAKPAAIDIMGPTIKPAHINKATNPKTT